MLKQLIPAIIILTISAAIAEAGPFSYIRKQTYYVAFTGATALPTEIDMDFSSSAVGGNRNGDAEIKLGFGTSGAFGMHLGDSWRLELEYSYRNADYDSYSGSGTFPASPIEGNYTSHNLMVNALYDLNFDTSYYWYAGGGLGFSRSKLDLSGLGSDGSFNFAFQIMTGIGYRITQETALYFGYRLFGTLEQEYRFHPGGARIESDVKGPNIMHIFEAGVRFDF